MVEIQCFLAQQSVGGNPSRRIQRWPSYKGEQVQERIGLLFLYHVQHYELGLRFLRQRNGVFKHVGGVLREIDGDENFSNSIHDNSLLR
jgi:hypothetical protein